MRLSEDEARMYRGWCDRYAGATRRTVYAVADVLDWLASRGELPPGRSRRALTRRVSAALRTDTLTLPSGAKVRPRYSVRVGAAEAERLVRQGSRAPGA
jgi:hypothetical protein